MSKLQLLSLMLASQTHVSTEPCAVSAQAEPRRDAYRHAYRRLYGCELYFIDMRRHTYRRLYGSELHFFDGGCMSASCTSSTEALQACAFGDLSSTTLNDVRTSDTRTYDLFLIVLERDNNSYCKLQIKIRRRILN